MEVPTYIAARVRRPIPEGCSVIPGSTPVVSLGKAATARVATLGLNPSKREFASEKGVWLVGDQRRLATYDSLGVDDHARSRLDPHVPEIASSPSPAAGRDAVGGQDHNRKLRIRSADDHHDPSSNRPRRRRPGPDRPVSSGPETCPHRLAERILLPPSARHARPCRRARSRHVSMPRRDRLGAGLATSLSGSESGRAESRMFDRRRRGGTGEAVSGGRGGWPIGSRRGWQRRR